MAIYSRSFSIIHKADQSPLTEADTAANEIITERLRLLTPDIPILSEESFEAFTTPNAQGRYWLVDPLDGTKEFIKRNGEFTVNIALIEHGKPVLGVVGVPACDILYVGAINYGAFLVDADAKRTRIRVAQRAPDTPWKVVSSRSHAGDNLEAYLAHLGEHELIPMGVRSSFAWLRRVKRIFTRVWDQPVCGIPPRRKP